MLTRHQRLLLIAPFLLIVVPFLIWPTIWGLFITFTTYAPTRTDIRFVGLNNYLHLLGSTSFQTALRNAFGFTLITVSAQLLLGLWVAYLLRHSFRGRGLYRVLILLPWLISPVAAGVMWHYLLNIEQGILNYWPALLGLPHTFYPLQPGPAFLTMCLVEIWRKTPLVIFLLLPSVLAIPADSWDMARLDGLGWLAQLRVVVVPRLRLLLATVALLMIGDALGTSESVYILTGGGPGLETILPGLVSFQHVFVGNNWSDGATSAWIIVALMLIIGLGYVAYMRRSESL